MVVGCRSVHAALWNPAHLLLMHIVSSDAEMHSLVGSALVAQRETSNNTPYDPCHHRHSSHGSPCDDWCVALHKCFIVFTLAKGSFQSCIIYKNPF